MKVLARFPLHCAVAAALTAPMATSACGPSQPEPSREHMSQPTIEEVQEDHTEEWMALPGVVGTGIGLCDGEPCIKVFLSEASEEAERAIPDEIEGYPVELEVTGGFEPREER